MILKRIEISSMPSEIENLDMGNRFRSVNPCLQCSSLDSSHGLAISRRHSAEFSPKSFACNHQNAKTKERVKPCGALGKPKVANLLQIQQVLDNVKGVKIREACLHRSSPLNR